MHGVRAMRWGGYSMAVRQSGSAVGQDGARQSRKRQSEPVPAASDSKRHGGAVCLGMRLRLVQGFVVPPAWATRSEVGTREEESWNQGGRDDTERGKGRSSGMQWFLRKMSYRWHVEGRGERAGDTSMTTLRAAVHRCHSSGVRVMVRALERCIRAVKVARGMNIRAVKVARGMETP